MSGSTLSKLGKYQIVEEIGRGGMGAVYKGYDPALDRAVAIKILAPHLVWEKTFLERFMREARTAARLQHPNIVPVYDVGQEGDKYYFVMAFLSGLSLKKMIVQKGRFPLTEALPLLRQLADALDYAHSKGLVHRDVKPANVMFNEHGQAILTDFGIVKATEGSQLTGSGMSVGTPHYMAPEQIMGAEVDARADQYALGIIAFEMLAGRVPFDADTTTAVLMKHVNEPPPSITACCPAGSAPPAIGPVMNRVLSKSQAKRYSSCREFVDALEQASAQPVALPQPARQPVAPPQPVPQPIVTLVADAPPSSKPLSGLKYEPSPVVTLLQSASDADILSPAPVSPAQSLVPAPTAPPALQPGPLGWAKTADESPRPWEMILLALCGLISLVGFVGAACNLFPTSSTGEASLQFLPACASPALVGLGGAIMLWFRRRAKLAWAPLLAALALWSIGVMITGGGITSVFLYKEPGEFMSNLGWSTTLCLIPGAFFTLFGLLVLGYGYWRSRRIAVPAPVPSADAPVVELGRADKIRRAAEYRARIVGLIKQKQIAAFGHHVNPIISKLDQWEARLHQLANRITAFEADPVIQRDIKDIPVAAAQLAAQMETEPEPRMLAQMQETLARYREQQQQLDALCNLMRRTELEIDKTLASIGTLYSQLQLLSVKDIDSNRANRFQADLEEQVKLLDDLLSAMDDLYKSST